jgi:hypothetical protein
VVDWLHSLPASRGAQQQTSALGEARYSLTPWSRGFDGQYWFELKVSFNTTVGGAYSALLSPDFLKPEIKQELITRGAVHCTTTEYLLMRSNALQDLGTSMQLLQQVHWVTVVA